MGLELLHSNTKQRISLRKTFLFSNNNMYEHATSFGTKFGPGQSLVSNFEVPLRNYRRSMKPRLPRKISAAARINLNRFWNELEEFYNRYDDRKARNQNKPIINLPAYTTDTFDHDREAAENALNEQLEENDANNMSCHFAKCSNCNPEGSTRLPFPPPTMPIIFNPDEQCHHIKTSTRLNHSLDSEDADSSFYSMHGAMSSDDDDEDDDVFFTTTTNTNVKMP